MHAVRKRLPRLRHGHSGNRHQQERNSQLVFVTHAPQLLGAIVRYQHTAIRQDE
jgi:hypothetical protein